MQPISYKIKKTKTNKQTNKQKKEELLSNKLTHEWANMFNPNLNCTCAQFLAQNQNPKFEYKFWATKGMLMNL